MCRTLLPLLALTLMTTSAEAARQRVFDPLDHALRHAALELAAGRPGHAAAALARATFDARRNDREALATLLVAESRLLDGQREQASAIFDSLMTLRASSVRARAAAHRLAIALQNLSVQRPDAISTRAAARALAGWERDRQGLEAEEAGLADLVAAALALHTGDAEQATSLLERVQRGPASPAAALLRAESALISGDTRAARRHFETLARVARREGDAEGWFAGWARIGSARTLAAAGDTTAACAAFESASIPAPLAAESRLLRGTWALATHDAAAAARVLAGLDLRSLDPTLEAEARLLELQAALDRGAWVEAEAISTALQRSLPELEREAGKLPFARTLGVDLRAFHATLCRRTLEDLRSVNVLRHLPQRLQLADTTAIVRFDADLPAESRGDFVRLQPLFEHAPEPAALGSERNSWKLAAAARDQVTQRLREAEAARTRLVERRELVDRGRAALAAARRDLSLLDRAAVERRAGIAAHATRAAAVESALKAFFRGRLAALATALEEVERAGARLAARYPEDRSVREREATSRARAFAAGTESWAVAAESLHTEVTTRFEARLEAVFREHELGADMARLESLEAWLATLVLRLDSLELALGRADAAERSAVAQAAAALTVAVAAQSGSERTAQRAAGAAAAALAGEARLRATAYAEAAAWGGATAAVQRALAGRTEATIDADLTHAIARIEQFGAAFPHSPHAAEALYRLGECTLQQAAREYQRDLADYLARGGSADRAPVPVDAYAGAVEIYRRLLREYPGSKRAQDATHQLGFVLADMGAWEESSARLAAFLAAADSLDPRRGRVALRLGDDWLLLGKTETALPAFRIAARAPDLETRSLGLFKAGWCAFDLDRYDEARAHLQALLAHALQDSAAAPRATELAAEALELLALAFAADHDAQAAAAVLDAWRVPEYDFALLHRMAQLFATRALYDQAIAIDELLLIRHPLHPRLPAVGEELLRWIEMQHGTAALHRRAARLTLQFAPGSEWAQAALQRPAAARALSPQWQSRLVSEDVGAARDDSLARALAQPEAAAARMAERLRAAAVYEHRIAQRDSLHGEAAFTQAAALYERVLARFPGAEDEARTCLYLGEARFALGNVLGAAEAYERAAAHPRADSGLAQLAAWQQLAALDVAAGSDPRHILQRYADTTERFANRFPDDVRSVDAWARVGEIGFDAGLWELAERGYLQVAGHARDPLRAAAALKLVGDVAWRRDRFEAAARRYDEALTTARQARADSLADALERLVPAALYREAETREARGDRASAAQAFAALVARHPRFEFADLALERAAGLRAATGDSTAAADVYDRLVQLYPRSARVAGARLERARCREAIGQGLQAARDYREFALCHPGEHQARAARLRAGLLFAAAGEPAAADSEYAAVLRVLHPPGAAPQDPALAADLWVRRARLANAAAAAAHWRRGLECGNSLGVAEQAEAHFRIAEATLPEYRALTLGSPLQASLVRKQRSLELLAAGYGRCAATGVEPWHAAACLRLGELLADFAHGLRTSPPPSELEGEDLLAFQQSLADQADTLEDRAVESWSQGLRAARRAQLVDDWTRALEARLYPALAVRVPTRPAPLFVAAAP